MAPGIRNTSVNSKGQDKTQTYEKKEEYKIDGNNSTFSYSMTYEHHTTTSGAQSATLPRRQIPLGGAGYQV